MPSIGFAHIKGTRHEARPGAIVDAQGPVGDRPFCFVDVERAQVLRTVQNPRLIRMTTSLVDDTLTVTLPDGRSASGVPAGSGERLTCSYWKRPVDLELTDGPHSALASEWLGKSVRLARAHRGDVIYGAGLSIVTTASMRELADQSGHHELLDEAARFRATLVLDTDEPFIEETWRGRDVMLNVPDVGALRVQIGEPIARCAILDLDPITGERGSNLLKTLVASRPRNEAGEPYFGVNAEVIETSAAPDT
ncbi:MOSC domain-containing protein [Brevibacterium sp. VCM10]|uniref:MOSC domain-containing protein n=1 Tax=Brevibacterium sp. VCM10 TaxID=1381751 RepID=UPI00047051D4|nr:MOSC N-terminal beta barrel domain-containing protein [Brevibacterium sp. VCM10]